MRDNENVITRIFVVGQSKEDISDCNGNQILAKIGLNITKMVIISVVCNISMQSLVLR